jgi:rhamnose utilization protein RhaD (predicted bifunctional aldolase and dehydrogenase)
MIKEKTSLKGHYKFTLRDIHTGEVQVFEYDNIIPITGRTLIANNLTDATPDNNIRLNKAALGTGTNTPANSDTQLQTETYRNDLASRTNADNIAYVSAFFSATEVTGTFREAGIFADGASGANTGVLFSRVAINITKTNTQTLTLDWTLTIN